MDEFEAHYPRKNCNSLTELFLAKRFTGDSPSASDGNSNCNKRLKTSSNSYTLRLEHRVGGGMGNPGEERILLFRSDYPGVIAKVIFSSCPAKNNCPSSSLKTGDEFHEDELNEIELSRMAQAKIHVLEVKEAYRGRDLGGLLFTEVISALRNRYDSATTTSDDDSPVSSSIRCQLDAEEDSRRHNKLVNFYEALGCRIKPRAKVRFLNNNDGETYRRVPMQIALRHGSLRRRFVDSSSSGNAEDAQLAPEKYPWSSLVGIHGGFLPVFFKRHGIKININSLDHNEGRTSVIGPTVGWLIVEDAKGFCFRSTHGHHLLACPDGRILAVADTDNDQFESVIPHDWEYFECIRIPDTDESEYESSQYQDARQNELWLLKTSRGTFLSVDIESGCMICSTYPSFWKANAENFTLHHTTDTPHKRQHYKQSWTRQTVDYVRNMRQKYSTFNLKKMSIDHTLELMKNLPFNCFKIGSKYSCDAKVISIRTFLFTMAEEARLVGYPDWFQLVALIHDLGRVIKFIDIPSLMDFQDYDWTIAIMSRVVGCIPSQSTSFKEFSYLDSDLSDSRYNTNLGIYEEGCGIENLLLTWTGQEYLYAMLKYNNVAIPYEGLAIIRYFLLNEWHTHDQYKSFECLDDEDIKSLVVDFYTLRQQVKNKLVKELSDEDCERLWNDHYRRIVNKYGCSGDLDW